MKPAQIVKIEQTETRHAFRINGVTVAKRHLSAFFAGMKPDEKTFCRFLVAVPFIALDNSVDLTPVNKTASYMLEKARKINAAIGLNPEIAMGFVVFNCQSAEIDLEHVGDAIGPYLHDAFCDCGKRKAPQHYDTPTRGSATLH